MDYPLRHYSHPTYPPPQPLALLPFGTNLEPPLLPFSPRIRRGLSETQKQLSQTIVQHNPFHYDYYYYYYCFYYYYYY